MMEINKTNMAPSVIVVEGALAQWIHGDEPAILVPPRFETAALEAANDVANGLCSLHRAFARMLRYYYDSI